MKNCGLLDHAVYNMIWRDMREWICTLPETPYGKSLDPMLPQVRYEVEGMVILDLLSALPGITEYRRALLQMFPPPAVRFRDGRTWKLGSTIFEQFDLESPDGDRVHSPCRERLEHSLDYDRRWKRFQRYRRTRTWDGRSA